jgi:pimeloyl-ACP methyl ester carboxylesterase
MLPLLSSHFNVCAVDRRGHGDSGDSPEYSLEMEAEDVAAVADSGGPGCAARPLVRRSGCAGSLLSDQEYLEADPVRGTMQEPVDLGVVEKIETLIAKGEREQALVTFMREVVRQTPDEVAAMRSRPSWPTLVPSTGSQPRQMRALAAYRFDPWRMSAIKVPTLLLTGSKSTSPSLKRASRSLQASLPNSTLMVLEGQQHNAMDSGREQLAQAITRFLLGS